jgi:hypothetical protein
MSWLGVRGIFGNLMAGLMAQEHMAAVRMDEQL